MSPAEESRLRLRRVWTGLGSVMIAVVIVISLARLGGPMGPPGSDKVWHCIAYGALMFWWGMVQPGRRRAWALGLLFLGAALEGAQSLTGHRSLDHWDAVANGLGVLLAVGLLMTPAAGLLAWFDRQLADRLDTGAP